MHGPFDIARLRDDLCPQAVLAAGEGTQLALVGVPQSRRAGSQVSVEAEATARQEPVRVGRLCGAVPAELLERGCPGQSGVSRQRPKLHHSGARECHGSSVRALPVCTQRAQGRVVVRDAAQPALGAAHQGHARGAVGLPEQRVPRGRVGHACQVGLPPKPMYLQLRPGSAALETQRAAPVHAAGRADRTRPNCGNLPIPAPHHSAKWPLCGQHRGLT